MKKLFKKLTQKKVGQSKSNELSDSVSHNVDDEPVEKDMKWKMERISLNLVPHDVSCAAYDPVQRIIALGTEQGLLHIFGSYGVEYVIYPSTHAGFRIDSLQFAVNMGYLVGICTELSTCIMIWSLKHRKLKHKIEIKDSNITTFYIPIGCSYVYVASLSNSCAEINAIHISNGIISSMQVRRENTSVTCMESHPHHDHFLLVGYASGDCCVYNLLKKENKITFSHPVISTAVTSLSWSCSSDSFVVGYESGETIIWELSKPLLQQLHSAVSSQQTLPNSVQTPVTVLRNKGPKPIDVYWAGDSIYIAIQNLSSPENNISEPISETTVVQEKSPTPQSPVTPPQLASLPLPTITMDSTVTAATPSTLPFNANPTQQTSTSASVTTEQLPSPPVIPKLVPKLYAPPLDVSGIYRYSSVKNTPQKPQPIFAGNLDSFIPLVKMVPYKTLPEYNIKYGGIIAAGEFHIVDLTYNDNKPIRIGNFLAHDDTQRGEAIIDICIIENMSFMERIFANQKTQSMNSWPVDGGVFNLSAPHKIKTTSHLLAAQYRDGSAILWSVGGADTGGIVRICSLHQKQEGGKVVTHIIPWSRDIIIAAFDDGSLSFVDVRTLRSAHLSSPTSKSIARISPIQLKQQLVVAYADCSVCILDMSVSESMKIVLSISLTSENAVNDIITCLEIFNIANYDSFVLAVGFQSSRFVCLSLQEGEILFEVRPPSPKNSSLFALFALDQSECYPCMLPDADSMPYFVEKQKYDSMSNHPSNDTKWRVCFNAIERRDKIPTYLPSMPVFQPTTPTTPTNQPQSTELAVDIFINNGITLTDGTFEIIVNDSLTGYIAMYVQLGPASVTVGHGKFRGKIDIDLDDIQLLGFCQRLIITHDRIIRKYRVYTLKDKTSTRYDILGILDYDEGDEEIEQLIQGDISTTSVRNNLIDNVRIVLPGESIPCRMNPTDYHAEPIKFETKEAYLRNVIPKMNIYTRHHFANISELLKTRPDVQVYWSQEYMAPAEYIVQCREDYIQCSHMKFKHRLKIDKVKMTKSPSRYVAAKPTYMGDECVLLTLESSHNIRAYSLPKLECLMKHSLSQPHLLRSIPIPSACFTSTSSGTVMVTIGADAILQAQIIAEDEEPNIVVEPTLFVSNVSFPERPNPPIIGNIASGFLNRLINNVVKKLEEPTEGKKQFDHEKIECINLSKEIEAVLLTSSNNEKIVINSYSVTDDTLDTSKERSLGTRRVETKKQAVNKRDELFGSGSNDTKGKTKDTIGDSMNETKNVMAQNLTKVNERGEKLEQLSQRTTLLSQLAQQYAENTAKMKQKQQSWFF